MNDLRRMLVSATCVVSFAVGCGDPAPPTGGADASDVTDASDVSDVSDVRDVSDVSDVSDVPVVRDASDVPSVGDVSDVPAVGDVSDVPSVRDVSDVRDASDAGDVLVVADASDAGDVPPSGLLAPLPSRCSVLFEDNAALCRTATCAATANATVRCPGGGFDISVAASATRPRVTYTENQGGFHPTYAALDLTARTGTVEGIPSGNWPAKVLSTRDGGSYVAAYSADASDREALAVLTREAAGWRRTVVEGGRYVPISLGDGAHHADGRESFVYARGEGDTSAIMAATRAPDGTWSTSMLGTGPVFGRFAIDTAADFTGDLTLARWRFGVPSVMSRTLFVSVGAATPRQAYVQTPGTVEAFNHVALVSRAGSGPIVAIGLEEGVHVLLPGATAFSDTLVANTARGHDTTCPGDGGTPTVVCGTTRTCTARGTYGSTGSHDLARTADGRVWLVYVQQFLDRDYRVEYPRPMGPPGCPQIETVTADRTRTELVVAEVGAALTERARYVMNDGASTDDLDVDAAGNTLQIARLGNGDAPSGAPVIRFVAVDTAMLR